MDKRKRNGILAAIGIVVALLALRVFSNLGSGDTTVDLFAEVAEGNFEITVSAAGELIPEQSIDIRGPSLPTGNNRGRRRRNNIRATDLKILDIVPEGTIVKKGDYIAQLDRTNYENTLKDQTERIQELQTNLNMKLLDTAVVLTNLRDGIKNQRFTVEEAEITLKQSQYEPPTTIRKAEIDLDKARRQLNQLQRQYKLRIAQQLKGVNSIKDELEGQVETVKDLENYLSGFTVLAPSAGMVIYKKNRNGTKRKTGSTINPFDMVIATLPDLSTFLSRTHVSEIDVSKVKPGQEVNIKVDAYPDKAYTGKVISVGEIGEQLPNSDSKLFEVLSRIDVSDPNLRPSMTTDNEIIIKSFNDALYIPLECVHAESDGVPFVYTKNKTKQVVILGESNEKFVVVNEGLKPGTTLYRYTPEEPESFKLQGQNLISGISGSSGDS